MNYKSKAFVPKKKRQQQALQIPEGFPPQFIPIFNEADDNQKQAMIDEFNLLKAMEEEEQRNATFVPTKEELINYSDDDDEIMDDEGVYEIVNDVSQQQRDIITQQLESEKLQIEKSEFLKFVQTQAHLKQLHPDKVKFSEGSRIMKRLNAELFMATVPLSVVLEASLYVDDQSDVNRYLVFFQMFLHWKYPQYVKIDPPK